MFLRTGGIDEAKQEGAVIDVSWTAIHSHAGQNNRPQASIMYAAQQIWSKP